MPDKSGIRKITGISPQVKNKNRVNIHIDGVYRFSLDITQITDLGIKVGAEYTDRQLGEIESEGEFSKVYSRALEYCLVRPRSVKEMRDYLRRKTFARRYKTRKGDVKERPGVSIDITDCVLSRLIDRGYVDDEAFAKWWAESRSLGKGASLRKLQAELAQKGVDRSIAEKAVAKSGRNDQTELQKIILKKEKRYPDQQKFLAYLMRQGFSYDDVRSALNDTERGVQ